MDIVNGFESREVLIPCRCEHVGLPNRLQLLKGREVFKYGPYTGLLSLPGAGLNCDPIQGRGTYGDINASA